MKYINVTCLHGIGCNPVKQKTYASLWEQYMNLSIPKDKEVKVRCVGMQWDSSGDSMRDLANVVTSKQFRDDQIGHLHDQVADYLPMTSVFLAHSLGCSWMMAVLSKLRHQPTLVGVGGPMGHPIWGKILKSVGLCWDAPPVNQQPIAFWNADDGVSSLGNWYSSPQGWEPRRIEVFPQRVGGFTEHADFDYLTHPNVIKYLTEAS